MELKLIKDTLANRGQLYAALDIYREQVRPEEQNPESQILHWIDHRGDIKADEFRCFTLNKGDKVLGYLQYTYFSEEQLFFWEYLCLSKEALSGLGPNRKIIKAIASHLNDNYTPGFTIVFEVAFEKSAAGKRASDKKRLNYFARLGFRKIDYPYRYPVLQNYDGEISYPADLLVLLPNRRKKLSGAELRTIIRCLYYKHYLRWDKPFLDQKQFEGRQQLIDNLYASQISHIGNTDDFDTWGDDNRLGRLVSETIRPRIGPLLSKVFGPKLPRLLVIIAVLLIVQQVINSTLLLIPFVLAAAVFFCLAEDTANATKILSLVVSRLSISRLQQ